MSLKSLFMKDEPEAPAKPVEKQESQQPKTTSFSSFNGTAPTISQPTSGTDYTVALEQTFQQAQVKRPEYRNFVKALAKMSNKPLTEQQKYETIVDAQGVNLDDLLSSIDEFKTVLGTDKHEFDTGIAQAKKVNIEDKQAAVQSKEKEIQDLNAKIQQLQQDCQKLNGEIATSINEIQVEENNYNFAYNQRIALVENHSTNLQNLKNATVTK